MALRLGVGNATAALNTLTQRLTEVQDMADDARQTATEAVRRAEEQAHEVATVAGKQVTLEQLAADYQAALAASLADRAELRQIVASLAARAFTGQTVRVTTTAPLTLGGSVDLTAAWPTAWADAGYTAIPVLDVGAGIAVVEAPVIKAQTKTTVTVTVKARLTVAAGLSVNVLGMRVG